MPQIVVDALWGLVTVVIIMGGILSGVFTPTESAAVACVYAFLVTFFVYRDYKWRELPHLVHRVVKTVAMVMMLIGFSVAFGYMMAIMQIPAKVTQFFLGISDNKYVFLLLVNILLLLLGTFMDLAPMLLICTPIFMPVILKLGIDPVHFGMIMILNLGIGLITPPVGPTLFVGCAIGKVTMEQVSKELWPFYGAMCLALLLVTYIPGDLAVAAESPGALIRPEDSRSMSEARRSPVAPHAVFRNVPELDTGDVMSLSRKQMEADMVVRGLLAEARASVAIQRDKRLGEMNPEQLGETTMNPAVRRLLKAPIEDGIASYEILTS